MFITRSGCDHPSTLWIYFTVCLSRLVLEFQPVQLGTIRMQLLHVCLVDAHGQNSTTPLSAQGSYDIKNRRTALGSWSFPMLQKTRRELLLIEKQQGVAIDHSCIQILDCITPEPSEKETPNLKCMVRWIHHIGG